MMEDIRKIALANAMELSRSYGGREASLIVKDASVFEAYLCGTVNNLSCLVENSDCLVEGRSCASGLKGGDGLTGSCSKACRDKKDKPLSGCDITSSTHENNSSQKENMSGQDLSTPSRTETITSENTPVMQACTHTQGAEARA